jgi:glutamyl endopeptidase
MAAAVSLTAWTAGLGAHARTAQAADLNLGVVSNGASIKAVEVLRTYVPSFRGQARGGRALDSLADVKARGETPSEFAKLLALPPVPSPKSTPETILPPDTRVLVSPTTGFPASATTLVTFSAGRCTGWLINANTVVTAGHCVHQGGGGAFYPTGSYRVYPGRDGVFSPFGSCTARWLATVVGWAVNGDDQYDYGVIKLNCTIGNATGWYGFFWQSASLTGLPTIINGYPGDKPLTQWQSRDRVTVTQARRVFYQNDTIGGMSGSAVYYNRPGCGICSMAVHAYGTYNGPPFSTNNHGTRITQAVFNNLLAWRNAP